jgi:hypothetical protein
MEEKELIVDNQAAPDNGIDVTDVSTSTDAEEKNAAVSSYFGTVDSASIDALSDEEKDLYNDFSEMTDSGVSAMPPDIRAELAELKNKLGGGGKQTTTVDTSSLNTEEENKDPIAGPESDEQIEQDKIAESLEAKTTEEDSADIINRLIEENRKLTARYDTLQGKYNAEIKTVRDNKSSAPVGDTSNEQLETSGGESDESLAERTGLDPDIIKAIREVQNSDRNHGADSDISARIATLEMERDNAGLDAAMRDECFGLSLSEVGRHPFFRSYAEELVNGNGASAWDVIAEAKANRDYRRVASAARQVVEYMDGINRWELKGRYRALARPASTVVSSVHPQSGNAGTPEKTTVLPSSVSPHTASGVSASALHTGRTAAQAEQEYDQLHKLFLKGKRDVLPRMMQLEDEITRLQIRERTRTTT